MDVDVDNDSENSPPWSPERKTKQPSSGVPTPFKQSHLKKMPVKAAVSRKMSNMHFEDFNFSSFIVMSFLVLLVAFFATRIYHIVQTQNTYCQTLYLKDIDCVACPENGICTRNEVKCLENYILQPHFSTYFLPSVFQLPFPFRQPKCVFDNQKIIIEERKQQQVIHLIKMLDDIVRKWVGDVLCDSNVAKGYEWVFSSTNPGIILGMPQKLSKDLLFDKVGKKWSKDVFEDMWIRVQDSLNQQNSNFAIRSIVDNHSHSRRLLQSSNPPVLSISCVVTQETWNFIDKYATYLIFLGVLIFSFIVASEYYKMRVQESQIVSDLVSSCIDAIHSESDNHERDPTRHPINGLSVSQLLDHFAPLHFNEACSIDSENRKIFNLSNDARTRVWKAVSKQILRNSNVRETVLKHRGESQIVWMWIGSCALSPVKKRRVETVQIVGREEALPIEKSLFETETDSLDPIDAF
jgi:hypothetical protein